MANLPFDFTEADRSDLVDELTKLIAQVPRLVGMEVNWIDKAVQAILRSFEDQGMGVGDPNQLLIGDIRDKIHLFAASGDPSATSKAASSVHAKLQFFFKERNQPSWVKDPSIPTDETHEFSLGFSELYEHSGRASQASEVLTEAEALAEMAKYKEANGVQRLILLARPKPQPWTVLDYQG